MGVTVYVSGWGFFFLHSNLGTEATLTTYAEDGLKELILCAGLAHIDSVIEPVLQ